jgi:hypothetical protein
LEMLTLTLSRMLDESPQHNPRRRQHHHQLHQLHTVIVGITTHGRCSTPISPAKADTRGNQFTAIDRAPGKTSSRPPVAPGATLVSCPLICSPTARHTPPHSSPISLPAPFPSTPLPFAIYVQPGTEQESAEGVPTLIPLYVAPVARDPVCGPPFSALAPSQHLSHPPADRLFAAVLRQSFAPKQLLSVASRSPSTPTRLVWRLLSRTIGTKELLDCSVLRLLSQKYSSWRQIVSRRPFFTTFRFPQTAHFSPKPCLSSGLYPLRLVDFQCAPPHSFRFALTSLRKPKPLER